jgi:putative hydrolase of the HAD superfamily
MNIKVIAFDADDTLWINEPYFKETEDAFCQLLEDFAPHHTIERELLKMEIQNLPLYGYGIKGFMLSMVETYLSISNKNINPNVMEKILNLGKGLLAKPIELLEGVEEVITSLKTQYRLVVATKGDLLDQERKLKSSGIDHHFHHIEIMSEKAERDYLKLLKHLDIQPSELLMVGNSLKSDIIPVLNIGGYAFHIPYHTNWAYEQVEHTVEHNNFKQLVNIQELLNHLPSIKA